MVFWADLCRIRHIVSVVVKHLLAHMIGARLAHWPWLARRLSSQTLPGAERLRMVFEEVGGTFIKLGQMLALQPDILSLEYPQAKQTDPNLIIDPSLVKRIEQSGFIDALYKK